MKNHRKARRGRHLPEELVAEAVAFTSLAALVVGVGFAAVTVWRWPWLLIIGGLAAAVWSVVVEVSR